MMKIFKTIALTTVVLMGLDLLWLGWIGDGFYRSQLSDLRVSSVYWPAALAFYGLYMSLILQVARRARSITQAAKYGGWSGFYTYGVYELTNWAVIRDWPAALVLPDWIWGVVLTSVCTVVAHWTLRPRAQTLCTDSSAEALHLTRI